MTPRQPVGLDNPFTFPEAAADKALAAGVNITVEDGQRGGDLHDRAARIASLRDTIEQRIALIFLNRLHLLAGGTEAHCGERCKGVDVVGWVADHCQHLPRFGIQNDR